MTRKRLCMLIVGIPVLAAILLCLGVLHLYHNYYLDGLNSPLNPEATEQRFVVDYGQSLTRVARNLRKNGLIADPRILRIFARMHPDRISIKAGEYMLSAAMTPREILDQLVAGKVITYSVTFPEGLTIREMADVWDRSGFGTAEGFLDAVSRLEDPFIETPPTGWEGYLYPDTYLFTADFDADALVAAMRRQFQRELRPEWLAAAREHGLTRHGVVTLASLIEEETRVPAERPLVSSVFHNRLEKGMLLQCDPTVIYALGDRYTGRLLKKHLVLDLPYNTYMHPGLPPGPIASPGAESLKAACFPADTDFLYFVADHTGGHAFSRTLSEHNRAVRLYREGMKQ